MKKRHHTNEETVLQRPNCIVLCRRLYALLLALLCCHANLSGCFAADKSEEAREWLSNGNAHQQYLDYASAEYCFTKSIMLDPTAGGYSRRGLLYAELGAKDKSLRDHDMAVELSPADATTYGRRGDSRLIFRQYQGALQDFTKALELCPRCTFYFVDRGKARYFLADYRKAIADLNAGMAEFPVDEAYYYRAKSKLALGDKEGARQDLYAGLKRYDELSKRWSQSRVTRSRKLQESRRLMEAELNRIRR